MDFRFTLFNDCTLVVMALAIVLAVNRFRASLTSLVPFFGYAVLLAYAFGFQYSLSPYVLFAGLAAALLIRVAKFESARWAELPVYLYVLWRGTSLLAGW